MNFKKYYLQQVDEVDCGAATLGMVLKYYHTKLPLFEIKNVIGFIGHEGISLHSLKVASSVFHLIGEAISYKGDKVREDLLAADLQVPFIAHVIVKGSLLHYFVVFKMSEEGLVIGDPNPNEGIKTIDWTTFEKEWTKKMLLISPADDYEPIKSVNPLVSLFKKLLRENWVSVSLVSMSAVLLTIIEYFASMYMQVLVDRLVPKGEFELLGLLSVALLLGYVIQQGLTYFQGKVMLSMNKRLTHSIVFPYLNELFKIPVERIEERNIGDFTSRLTDASVIISTFGQSIISVFLDFWLIGITYILLLRINVYLALLILFLVPVYFTVAKIFYPLILKTNKKYMELEAQINSKIVEEVKGILTIRAVGAQNTFSADVNESFDRYIDGLISGQKYNMALSTIKVGCQLLMSALILWTGGIQVIKGNMSLGSLIAFNSLLGFLLGPLERTTNLQGTFQSASVAYERILEITSMAKHDVQRNEKAIEKTMPDLKVKNISFSYQGKILILYLKIYP